MFFAVLKSRFNGLPVFKVKRFCKSFRTCPKCSAGERFANRSADAAFYERQKNKPASEIQVQTPGRFR